MGYRQEDFIEVLKEKVDFDTGDALSLAQQFLLQQSGDRTTYVDQRKFEDYVAHEDCKYNRVIQKYQSKIEKIQKALRKRHTGSYKFFLQHSSHDNTLDKKQWKEAIKELGYEKWDKKDRDGIFNGL